MRVPLGVAAGRSFLAVADIVAVTSIGSVVSCAAPEMDLKSSIVLSVFRT